MIVYTVTFTWWHEAHHNWDTSGYETDIVRHFAIKQAAEKYITEQIKKDGYKPEDGCEGYKIQETALD